MLTPVEVEAVLSRLDFLKSHTAKCQRENGIKRYDQLKRKNCACAYYSCGVHDAAEGFKRKPTDEITLPKAQDVVRKRLETGNARANLEPNAVTIEDAIKDYLGTVVSKERSDATLSKYKTLMDQLEAFSKYKGYATLRAFDQDAMQEFFNSWSDPNAPYKKGTKWTKMSRGTCKRNRKTMRLFFKRCMRRKWITEDPSEVIEITPEPRKKTREQVKYLTREQMKKIMGALDENYHQMTEYNKTRLKALMFLMRWTGLRISDAVKVKRTDIKKDVLFVVTKKTKTPIQLPLPSEALSMIQALTPHEGGYLFWDRRSEESSIKTCEHNFGTTISKLFVKAGVKEDVRHVSHRFRNTFAVHLLTKGVPLETVSLMLTHKNIQTTEDYYADYATSYMDRAENMLRNVWTLGEGETL